MESSTRCYFSSTPFSLCRWVRNQSEDRQAEATDASRISEGVTVGQWYGSMKPSEGIERKKG